MTTTARLTKFDHIVGWGSGPGRHVAATIWQMLVPPATVGRLRFLQLLEFRISVPARPRRLGCAHGPLAAHPSRTEASLRLLAVVVNLAAVVKFAVVVKLAAVVKFAVEVKLAAVVAHPSRSEASLRSVGVGRGGVCPLSSRRPVGRRRVGGTGHEKPRNHLVSQGCRV